MIFKKISENFRKCSKIFQKFRKCSEILKISKTVQNYFQEFICFLELSENLWKSSEVFGNLRKLENFGNGSMLFFRSF